MITDLNERIKRAVAAFNALSPAEQEAELRAQRESFARSIPKSMADLSDAELKHELWVSRIEAATGWGAGLAASFEFRDLCEKEMKRRDLA
jgi:hypothetical protein